MLLMQKFSLKVLLTAATALSAITIAPAQAASGNGDATVQVLQAFTLAKTSDLGFGKLIPSAAAGTINIAEDGTRTCAASLTCFGTTSAGGFSISGSSGETVSVGLDSDTITLTNGASATISGKISTSSKALTLEAGQASFKIAGLLSVGANQAGGTYRGQYAVSVNYQ
jgi:Mat/Ecp fimbriae major subunit